MRAVLRNRLQPADGTLEQRQRRHQIAGAVHVHRLEHISDQPHVVIKRQPADAGSRPLLRAVVQCKLDDVLVRQNVAVRNLHPFRVACRAGGVLQQRNRVARDRGRLKPCGRRFVEIVRHQEAGRSKLSHAVPRGDDRFGDDPAGQNNRRTTICSHLRHRSITVVQQLPPRRINRNGDNARLKAGEQRGDELEPRGINEQSPIAGFRTPQQLGRKDARAQFELPIRQRLRLELPFIKKAEDPPIGNAPRAVAQNLYERLFRRSSGRTADRHCRSLSIIILRL
jgi:hypothetical protein